MTRTYSLESDDLTNLIYTLHASPVIDTIVIKEIVEHTAEDQILNELRKLKSGENYIPKGETN